MKKKKPPKISKQNKKAIRVELFFFQQRMSLRATVSLRRLQPQMISFPNRRQPQLQSSSSSQAFVAAAAVSSFGRRVSRDVPTIPLGKFGQSKVVNYGSVFELPPIYRGQPLSAVEIDAILSGGANAFDVKKTDAKAPATTKKAK
jgi:hypothetical protein